MSEIASEKPVEELHSGGSGEVIGTNELAHPGKPTITFKGNTYDLMSLGSLIAGVLILFSCLTCNMGYYCLPFIPAVLGIVGVITARQAVEPERTRLWSWLSIAASGIVFLLIAAAIVLYIGLIVVMIATGEME
jgi:hypothetical protein